MVEFYSRAKETLAVKQKFDGLADDYDNFRPRYPKALFEAIVARMPQHRRISGWIDLAFFAPLTPVSPLMG